MNHSRYSRQDELESHSGWEHRFECWIRTHFDFVAIAVLAAGFLIRLGAAQGTFLNPDEALHYLLANQASWHLAYRASLTNAQLVVGSGAASTSPLPIIIILVLIVLLVALVVYRRQATKRRRQARSKARAASKAAGKG